MLILYALSSHKGWRTGVLRSALNEMNERALRTVGGEITEKN